MKTFKGFPDGRLHHTPIPVPFFTDLLSEIDHLGELKVVLYAFWRFDRTEGAFRFLRRKDFLQDQQFIQGMGVDPKAAEAYLDESLQRATEHAILLEASLSTPEGKDILYFLNTPKGRDAQKIIRQGKWRYNSSGQAHIELSMERPNIFRLYEENIGPLTPMIADRLRDAEEAYPAAWVDEAMRIAVENNIRRWSYIEAILRSWKEEGRDEQNRRDPEKDRRRYIEGKFAKYFEH
ncbi:MAG: DnaD domain-containing protein [Omnitrophica WOR_2 bacterium]